MLLFKATYSKKEKQKQFVTEPTIIVIYCIMPGLSDNLIRKQAREEDKCREQKCVFLCVRVNKCMQLF